MVFCNVVTIKYNDINDKVTILILIDGFLQSRKVQNGRKTESSHNPYFNRWFSAILNFKSDSLEDDKVTILILIDGFLQW